MLRTRESGAALRARPSPPPSPSPPPLPPPTQAPPSRLLPRSENGGGTGGPARNNRQTRLLLRRPAAADNAAPALRLRNRRDTNGRTPPVRPPAREKTESSAGGGGKQKAPVVVVVAVAGTKENRGEDDDDDDVVVADDNAATAAAAAAAAGAAPAETANSDKNNGIDMPGAAGVESDTAAAGPREDLLRRPRPTKPAPLSTPGGDGGRERGRTRRAGRAEAAAFRPAAVAGAAPTDADTDGISSLRGSIIPLTQHSSAAAAPAELKQRRRGRSGRLVR